MADEFDGAGGDLEGAARLGEVGNGEGFGGFGVDEVLDVDDGTEMLLALDDVVEAAVADPVDGGGVDEGAEGDVAVGVVGGGGGAEEGEVVKGRHWWVVGFA